MAPKLRTGGLVQVFVSSIFETSPCTLVKTLCVIGPEALFRQRLLSLFPDPEQYRTIRHASSLCWVLDAPLLPGDGVDTGSTEHGALGRERWLCAQGPGPQ